jgi:hypothetical protein
VAFGSEVAVPGARGPFLLSVERQGEILWYQ